MNMKNVAYVVTVYDNSTVYFDISEDGAWNQWKQDNAGCESCSRRTCECYSVESVERAPSFDQYAGSQQIPVEAFHRAWWAWKCAECPEYVEHYGPGDWRVVKGRGLCLECADIEEGNAS